MCGVLSEFVFGVLSSLKDLFECVPSINYQWRVGKFDFKCVLCRLSEVEVVQQEILRVVFFV